MDALAALTRATKRFGKTTALDDVDFAVRSREVVALLGPNGAGKSTIIGLLLGLTQPTSGEVRLFARHPAKVAARRGVGVMMQDVNLSAELRVAELIELVASYYPNPRRVEQTIDLAGVGAFARRPYGKLSGGQKRLAQFALAICGAPRLLFLDEPTANLDAEAREALWATVRVLVDEGCSVVLTTHHVEEAEALATRIVLIARGKIISSGSVEEVRSLVNRKHVSCVTRLSAADVADWTEVESASLAGGRLQITSTSVVPVVRRLLAMDATLSDLEVRGANLQEAISHIVEVAR